jgi:hypothetical protein
MNAGSSSSSSSRVMEGLDGHACDPKLRMTSHIAATQYGAAQFSSAQHCRQNKLLLLGCPGAAATTVLLLLLLLPCCCANGFICVLSPAWPHVAGWHQ